jgi:hypothetical protein
MQGIIEAISYERHGIKLDGVWFNARTPEIKEKLTGLNKGDTITLEADAKHNITVLGVVKVATPEAMPTDEQRSLDFQVMLETVHEVGSIFANCDPAFRDRIAWDKIITTLFISKSRR